MGKAKDPRIQARLLLKAATFDLLTKRGQLEQQVQLINQAIQRKVSELRRMEEPSDD